MKRSRLFEMITLMALGALHLCAQPTGGPYGPVQQSYDVPKAARVYYVAPDGKAEAAGTLEAPATIEKAIEQVVTGDAIILRGGVYRTGNLVLSQGVTIQPYRSERVILKGTEVPAQWENTSGKAWRVKWTKLFPAAPQGWWQRRWEGAKTPLVRFNCDMVFADGEQLMPKTWEGELDEHSFYIDYTEGYVYVGVDPKAHLIEVTAHDSALVRTGGEAHGKANDHKGPVIRGITFTQYAYRALEIEGKKHFNVTDEPTNEPVGLSDPATFGKEVIGTVLENVTISHCSRVAGYFRGDGLIIRNSLVTDTGTEGIYVIGSADVLLERNIIRRNNVRNLTGYFATAVKIFNQTRRVVFRDNLILEQPNSNGVQYDVGNRDGVIVNNYIEGMGVGFFFEISQGATVAGNVFVRCGRGVLALNSADVHVYNNTFLDSGAGFTRDGRRGGADLFGWHATTGPDVGERTGHVFVNNLMVASEPGFGPLLAVDQSSELCGEFKGSLMKQVEGNVYVRPSTLEAKAGPAPLIQYGPMPAGECIQRFAGIEEARKAIAGFDPGAMQLDLDPHSLFRGLDVNRFDLLKALPEPETPRTTPDAVRKLLGWSEQDAHTAGAYSTR